ncbi:MAG: hypothetical protein IPK16_12415 [Anaerolineales bacterium]|nr:hypothetical protein [Anaerolineales bacterium]
MSISNDNLNIPNAKLPIDIARSAHYNRRSPSKSCPSKINRIVRNRSPSYHTGGPYITTHNELQASRSVWHTVGRILAWIIVIILAAILLFAAYLWFWPIGLSATPTPQPLTSFAEAKAAIAALNAQEDEAGVNQSVRLAYSTTVKRPQRWFSFSTALQTALSSSV